MSVGGLSTVDKLHEEEMMATILIADDASFMRQMIREIIEPEGYEVVC